MGADFKSNRSAVEAQLNGNVVKCLFAIGMKWKELVVKEITDMEAVDTGRMRASNTYRVAEQTRETVVGNTAYYSIYVNCGTRRTKGRPFMQNSVLNYSEQYKQIVHTMLGEGF